jgi:hypothetical protein
MHRTRDLFLVTKMDQISNAEVEKEMQLLNEILYGIESMHTFALVNEVLDMQKYKVIKKPHLVADAIRKQKFRPFVFLYNKN